jgi:hypothetical protein
MIVLQLVICMLHFCMSHALANTQSGLLKYKGNTSYFDKSLLIYETVTVEADVSLRYCAAECHRHVDCNAVELCSTATGNVCRLSRNITTPLTSGKNTCFRYELVRIENVKVVKCYGPFTL